MSELYEECDRCGKNGIGRFVYRVEIDDGKRLYPADLCRDCIEELRETNTVIE